MAQHINEIMVLRMDTQRSAPFWAVFSSHTSEEEAKGLAEASNLLEQSGAPRVGRRLNRFKFKAVKVVDI
jgi:hypothetical protein